MMAAQHNIEGLIFDLGGVVIDVDFDQALQIWAQHSRLPIEGLRARFKMDVEYECHERGEIDAHQYFSHLRNLLELEADDAEISTGWNSIFGGEITETVNDILAIRSRLPCFAFSNSNPTHQITWMADYPRAVSSFHKIFVSSELGYRKPERESFEAIAKATGINLAAMLFFDDTVENVVGAREAGLQAVHVKTPADITHALEAIGEL